jgi:regulator of sirC expression with transglutaminase-like and TPR domain
MNPWSIPHDDAQKGTLNRGACSACYDPSVSDPPAWEVAPLRAVVSNGELRCSVEEAALVLARQEYDDLDPAPYLGRIDAIAALARPMLSPGADPPEVLGVVNDVLFRDLGFRGNADDYYDARNSFLNEVLERRTGIPISLSTLYMAVARRLGLRLQGTAFPGHFLLRLDRPGWPIVLDAFDRGRVLTVEDCQHLLSRLAGPAWNPAHLRAVSDLSILRRMLNNLKMIYFTQRDWPRLLRTASQMLVVTPDDHDEHFTRGVALTGIGELGAAIGELQKYLSLRPQAPNRDEVLDLLQDLRRRVVPRDD